MAMREAHGRHRDILFAWCVLSMAAAWIRFFPYTGHAVLVIDAAACLCWIAEKIHREYTPAIPTAK